jgi:hypothetical protein
MIDLYVAAKMRPRPALRAMLSRHGIQDADLRQAEAALDLAGFSDPLTLSEQVLFSEIGVPQARGRDWLQYDLGLWPSHGFKWGLTESGLAYAEGFVLHAHSSLPNWGTDVRIVVDHLEVDYHTQSEVREALGEPMRDESWGHVGEWYFGTTNPGEIVLLQFDFGLLTAIT